MYQQIGYRIEVSKKYYAICDDLLINRVDYSSEIFRIIDEIVVGTEQQQFIKTLPIGTVLYRAREIDIEKYSKIGNGLNIKVESNTYITRGLMKEIL